MNDMHKMERCLALVALLVFVAWWIFINCYPSMLWTIGIMVIAEVVLLWPMYLSSVLDDDELNSLMDAMEDNFSLMRALDELPEEKQRSLKVAALVTRYTLIGSGVLSVVFLIMSL